MRIAIVHDDLTQRGGAERVVEAMHQIWPDAPIYTSVYDPAGTFSSFTKMNVRTTFMQKLPLASRSKFNKFFLSLYPIAMETLDLRNYDVVLSSTTRFAHGVLTAPETCHISYCHSPARFAWRYHEYISESHINPIFQVLLLGIIHKLRIWDYIAAHRVDYYVANSYNTARRIRKFYGLHSEIVYPPIEVDRFFIEKEPENNYFLVVSRLLSYKKIDLAITACNNLKLQLKVVGNGPDFVRLRALAGPTVEVLGRVPDGEVEKLFANCRAFIFPGEEDFGIAPLEAMAAGRPVIAYRAGGAMETVIEGHTGIFFNEATPQSLMDAIQHMDSLNFDPAELRAHAETFGIKAFQNQLKMLVEHHYIEHRDRLDIETLKKQSEDL